MVDFEKHARERSDHVNKTGGPAQGGLTVLDWFAAAAMKALLSGLESGKEHQVVIIPKTAYDIAEVMLRERNKRMTPTDVVRGVTGKTYG